MDVSNHVKFELDSHHARDYPAGSITTGYPLTPAYPKLKSSHQDRFQPLVRWSTSVLCDSGGEWVGQATPYSKYGDTFCSTAYFV
jgi:hypothetical protein